MEGFESGVVVGVGCRWGGSGGAPGCAPVGKGGPGLGEHASDTFWATLPLPNVSVYMMEHGHAAGHAAFWRSGPYRFCAMVELISDCSFGM